MSEHQHRHVDDGTCGKCRKPLENGHRITTAFIVEGPGHDPSNILRKGLLLYEEFEFTHIDCSDPFLVKGA
jgi:hypothetical protein